MKLFYKFLLISISSCLFISPTLAENSFYRQSLPPQSIIFGHTSPAPEVDIIAYPGAWRENETINFPLSISPVLPGTIQVDNLPGSISYNPGLSSIVGNTSAGSPPYLHSFSVTAKGYRYDTTKTFDLYVYPELTATAPTTLSGRAGDEFSASPTASGIVQNAEWSISSSVPGLIVNPNSGAISGIPTDAGTYDNLVLTVLDSADGKSASTQPFSIQIAYADVFKTVSVGTNINIRTLFTDEEWNSDAPKFAVVPSEVIVGSSSTSLPALTSGSGWGGSLTLRINGEVQGAGGSANGGNGGNAIYSQDSRLIIENNGAIRAGGGGGAKGGNGGSGYRTDNQDSGWIFSHDVYCWSLQNNGARKDIWWGGTRILVDTSNPGATTWESGGWIYERGAHSWAQWEWQFYAIRRYLKTPVRYNGVAGVGGGGGAGQGYNSSNTQGAAGTAGTNNAGNGGTGGAGGTWGQAGVSGAPGTNGNENAGLSAGNIGSSGVAIQGSAVVSGSGIIQG